MEKQRKLNKRKVGIVIFLIVFAISIAVFGRYIYNSAREAYFTSKRFYFTSDRLTVNGTGYQYDNWGGVDPYSISFNLYSYINTLTRMEYDLNYTLTCESLSTDKITCSIGTVDGGTTANGTIYKAQNNTSVATIWVKPKEGASINKGETVKVKVTARTEEPYVKEISCIFSLYLKLEQQCTYSIEDVENRDYAVLKMVNGSDAGMPFTIEFDPNELRLDFNDEIYQDMTILSTTTINSKIYITSVEVNLAKESAKNLKFYKVDVTQDYTYPNGAAESAITVNI